jgi:beta-lactamase class A
MLCAPLLPARAETRDWAAELARLELGVGGRLGVAVKDTATGRELRHRPDERFPMCSTSKLLACAALLERVDRGEERLDRRIVFSADAVLNHSPLTKPHAGAAEGMTLGELCHATMTVSDNTALNLILDALGGPDAITRFAREGGDGTTRLDRNEPDLNEATPGDPRDTSTPGAMVMHLQNLVLGTRLSEGSRRLLTDWLVANTTGDARLHAGVPEGWRVGDKTGTGPRGTTNDVGLLWPPSGAPLVAAVYLTESAATLEARNAVLAAVAKLAVEWSRAA